MEQTKQQQLSKLLDKIAILNKKNKELEDKIVDLQLGKAQDEVKEELAFTVGFDKKTWDEVGDEMREVRMRLENSLTEEQQKLYDLLECYKMLAQLSQQNGKK